MTAREIAGLTAAGAVYLASPWLVLKLKEVLEFVRDHIVPLME